MIPDISTDSYVPVNPFTNPPSYRNSSMDSKSTGYDIQCKAYSWGMTLCFEYLVPNVSSGEKSCLKRNSNPRHLAYCASAQTSELLRPDILTNSLTPVNLVTYTTYKCFFTMFWKWLGLWFLNLIICWCCFVVGLDP